MTRYIITYSDGGEKVFRSKPEADSELSHVPSHLASTMSITPMVALEALPAKLVALENRRATLLDYLDMVTDREDWHGVMDAAADLRETDVELEMLRRILEGWSE